MSKLTDLEVKYLKQASWEQRSDEWQPIETAPKDGTAILVRVPDYAYDSSETMAVVRWRHECWELTRGGSYAEDHDLNATPTHWMPLPEPPVT